MPYRETEICTESKIESKLDNVEKNEGIKNVELQQKETIYWVKFNQDSFDDNILLSFHTNDILTRKIKPHDCRKLLINGFGARTSKQNDLGCQKIISSKHDMIRSKFKMDFKSSLKQEDVCRQPELLRFIKKYRI